MVAEQRPELSRDAALSGLSKLVETLRHDQADPRLGAQGLLVNFIDLATGKRLSPLASDVDKKTILDAFGRVRGESIWNALASKGWLTSRNGDREAAITRADKFGWEYFDGPLAPFRDDATKIRILTILDQRVVLVVFGDNANLSASAAKTVGALLRPAIANRPEVIKVRDELEHFLDAQRPGYAHLYDAKAGLFNFGWDATRDRLFGWEDLQGNWTTGHMDYFVNEFRGPATFVAARFGLPDDAIKNLGFKIKAYRPSNCEPIFTLAPWEGSAFQALGLGLSLDELKSPSWRAILGNVVAIELDYATRKGLPGFLSESYTGVGTEYTGRVGIADITVSPRPRITDAASLYSLGVAYSVAPVEVERFLATNWAVISTLLTPHGPWEGYNTSHRDAIRFQTTAHTLSLILGILGTGSANMARYADHAGFAHRLAAEFRPGDGADLLADGVQSFAWGNKGATVKSDREGRALRVKGERAQEIGVAFVASTNVNASGNRLTIRYRSTGTVDPLVVALKPAPGTSAPGMIPIEIFTRLEATGEKDNVITIPLPATPGLSAIKEVVFTHKQADAGLIDFTITRLGLGR